MPAEASNYREADTTWGSKATIGSATAFALCEFFSKEMSGNLKLLEYNVRLRLSSGRRKKDGATHVLNQTKKTMRKNGHFASRNNGLLIVAFDVKRQIVKENCPTEIQTML